MRCLACLKESTHPTASILSCPSLPLPALLLTTACSNNRFPEGGQVVLTHFKGVAPPRLVNTTFENSEVVGGGESMSEGPGGGGG